MRGKTYLGVLVPFGEQVLMKDIDGTEAGNPNPRWRKRVFVGKLDFTDEFLILTASPWEPRASHSQTTVKAEEFPTSQRTSRLYLKQHILDKFGRAPGCPGCLGIGAHSEQC
eukprot:5066169-Amphidinium_carterae.1